MMPSALLTTAVMGAAAAAAVIDLRTRRVPNVLTAAVAALGIAVAGAGAGEFGAGAAVAGGLIGLALMLPAYVFGGTGGGDVKLLAALGTLLGPRRTVTAFIAMALAGGAIAIIVALRRGQGRAMVARLSRLLRGDVQATAEIEDEAVDNRFAYAPAIAVGAAIAVLG
jgi:prepilin peptidase CpaA